MSNYKPFPEKRKCPGCGIWTLWHVGAYNYEKLFRCSKCGCEFIETDLDEYEMEVAK